MSDGLREHIEALIKEHGTLTALSRRSGISVDYLGHMRAGRKTNPGPNVLKKLGLRRVVRFDRIK